MTTASTSTLDKLDVLNHKYLALTPEERIKNLYLDFKAGDILLTSSFGTTAVYLLHMFYKQDIRQAVHFIDTSYHFEETLAYKAQLARLFDLEVIDVKPVDWKNEMTTKSRLWESQPDLCCAVNKVEPLNEVKAQYGVWISGLMRWQTDHRRELTVFEEKTD